MTTSHGPAQTDRGLPVGRLALGFLAGLALALAFGAGALLAYEGQYEDRIHPGVAVDGVDVSGLTREAASARLRERLAGYAAGTAVVSIDGREARIPFATLGRRADVEALVERAWAVGREGNGVLDRVVQGVRGFVDGTRIAPLVRVDAAAVDHQVTALALAVNRAPVSASATVTGEGFAAVPAAAGAVLPRAEVASALLAQLADPAAPDTLRLAYETVAVEPYVDDREVAAAIATASRMAVDLVLTAGADSWVVRGATVRSWISFAATTEGFRPTVAPGAPAAALTDLARRVDIAPREATLAVRRDGSVGAVAGRDGRALDVAASAPAVARAVVDRATAVGQPGPVPLVVAVVHPKLTTEEARTLAPRMRRVSYWTTYYEVSERNGFGNNITIPARDLDGVVVGPGAVFDFWRSIGPVTAARGYRYGGAIINGRSRPTGAFAGGICSTSTTLFNAVARAGYQVLTRHNHYYAIARYPTGLDATVAIENGAVTTMSWRNDSAFPVIIRSYARPGVVQFSIYAVAVENRPAVGGGSAVPGSTNVTYRVANGRTVTFRTSPKRNYDVATSSTDKTTRLRPGVVQVVEYATDGFDVTVTRSVREGGTLIRSDTWVSRYRRVDGQTLIGVAP